MPTPLVVYLIRRRLAASRPGVRIDPGFSSPTGDGIDFEKSSPSRDTPDPEKSMPTKD